jgi:hypothetical protein
MLYQTLDLADIVRMIGPRLIWLVGYVECMGEMRNAYKVLGLKHKGKSLHGIHRHK